MKRKKLKIDVDEPRQYGSIIMLNDDDGSFSPRTTNDTDTKTNIRQGECVGFGMFGNVYINKTTNMCSKLGSWKHVLHTSKRSHQNRCDSIMTISGKVYQIFPHNFPFIYNCDIQATENPVSKINFQIDMQCIRNTTTMVEYEKYQQNILSKMFPIYAQLYYIAHTLNNTYGLYHNDYFRRNILIGNTIETEIHYTNKESGWELTVYNSPRVYVVDLDFVDIAFNTNLQNGFYENDIDTLFSLDTNNTRKILDDIYAKTYASFAYRCVFVPEYNK